MITVSDDGATQEQRTLPDRLSRTFYYVRIGTLPFIVVGVAGLTLWTFWQMFGGIFLALIEITVVDPVRMLTYLAGIVGLLGVFAVTGYLIEGRVMEASTDE